HLYRALYIADEIGLRCAGASADPRRYAGQIIRDVREYLARVKDACFVLFGVGSKYGGDTVPISGNGDITNDRGDNTAKNRQYDAYF
ncbi:MAG: SanA protein, partial [Clostridia bacterium]|nr:SanA protein [Clostridia bacterium]